MSRTVCDVVIVGAGILGCATAFHLARKTGMRIIVVEKGSIASGMTKRSGALVHTYQPSETESRLALASLHDFENWKALTGGPCGFTKTGCLIVGGEPHAAILREQAGKNRILTPQDVKDLEPNANVDNISLAVYDAQAGYSDPVQATQTLATRAREYGVTFKTGTMLKSIRTSVGRITSVETTTGDIETLAVVLTTGAWTDRLLKSLGIQIGIQNTRAQVVFFDRPAELKQGHTAIVDLTTGAHFRPHTFGLTMGSLNVSAVEEKNPDSFDESVSMSYVADVQKRIAVRLPAMDQARYIRGHAGVFDATLDGRPIISRVPDMESLFVAAGFHNQGYALAPAVGACLAEMVADGEASTVDVSALSLDRLK